jgi:hypothetical protein
MDDEREKMMVDLQRTFGHRPDEAGGEKWTVFRNCLVVIHHDRRPRIYNDGCGGAYYEIEPHF